MHIPRHQSHLGFTLIEVLIALGIMVVITTLSLVDFRTADSQSASNFGAQLLVSDLRSVALKALGGERFQGKTPGGWGVYFEEDSNQYIIFADLDNDRNYDFKEKYKAVALDSGIKISWQNYSIGSLVFNESDAKPYAAGLPVNSGAGDVVIVLKNSAGAEIKSIFVNPAGAVNF